MSIVSIILAILLLGLLVISHEFGHFLLAKKNGIGVLEFAVGMGPKLVSFERGGTVYSINLIPFGGYCMMKGEMEENEDEDAFLNKSVWARFTVIAAGPVFNFLLAFILAVIVIGSVGVDQPRLVGVTEGYPAAEAGLQEGDIIKEINGKNIHVSRDITAYLLFHPGETVELTYERDGQEYETVITPKFNSQDNAYQLGILINNAREKVGPVETLGYSAYEVKYWISYTLDSLRMLVTGNVSRDDVSGPVGIVNAVGTMVEEVSPDGAYYIFLNLLNFAILLSANLGVINLLPIPAMDGGRLLFILIEAVRGKPISREKEGIVHAIGMAFLVVLMILVLVNDITKFF